MFESISLDGFPDADRRMAEIREVAGQYIAGMSPTVHVPAMLGYSVGNQYITKQITLIGVDETTYATVSDFGQLSAAPGESRAARFQSAKTAATTRSTTRPAIRRKAHAAHATWRMAGWEHRRRKAQYMPAVRRSGRFARRQSVHQAQTPADGGPTAESLFGATAEEGTDFDPAKEQHTGCVLGIGLCAYRTLDGADGFLAVPGDDVEISYPDGRQAAQGAQREVHDRRLLRKQDERIRLELRVRADPQSCRSSAA